MAIAAIGSSAVGNDLATRNVKLAPSGGDVRGGFLEAMLSAAAEAVSTQQQAGAAVQQFASGADTNLHGTILALEKAEISLKYMVSVRNKLLDAYREVMRMGV